MYVIHITSQKFMHIELPLSNERFLFSFVFMLLFIQLFIAAFPHTFYLGIDLISYRV